MFGNTTRVVGLAGNFQSFGKGRETIEIQWTSKWSDATRLDVTSRLCCSGVSPTGESRFFLNSSHGSRRAIPFMSTLVYVAPPPVTDSHSRNRYFHWSYKLQIGPWTSIINPPIPLYCTHLQILFAQVFRCFLRHVRGRGRETAGGTAIAICNVRTYVYSKIMLW